jgi:hypothetical protein
MLIRSRGIPEVYWIGAGHALHDPSRPGAPSTRWTRCCKGSDVYLFLIGMMLRSELAREQGVFDWLPSVAGGALTDSAHGYSYWSICRDSGYDSHVKRSNGSGLDTSDLGLRPHLLEYPRELSRLQFERWPISSVTLAERERQRRGLPCTLSRNETWVLQGMMDTQVPHRSDYSRVNKVACKNLP